jgi:hypothetical protein
MKNKSIRGRNTKKQWHGYQEIYDVHENLWCRSTYKNDLPIGYEEYNVNNLSGIGDNGTIVNFYIR